MKTKRSLLTLVITAMILIMGTFSVQAATVRARLGESQYTEVTAGRTIKLKVAGVSSDKVKWRSANKAVASVNAEGKVTVKKSGKATITAKKGTRKAVFIIRAYKNRWKSSEQDPAKCSLAKDVACFNTLEVYYKDGKLCVKGFWSNTTGKDYSKFKAKIDIYDLNNSSKLIAEKTVTYPYLLKANTSNGILTYVFSGKEVKAKNYDLRGLYPYTFSTLY